ncbi:MAG TPA: hypothetical protein PK614_08550 [Nitrospira sp.]|nr:hypothetical protein [Nitrospira sp.]
MTTKQDHAMDSHELAAKYQPLSDGRRAKLVGQPYPVPPRDRTTPELLKGYQFALITTHGPEFPEFDIPLTYLRDRGASVDVVTQGRGKWWQEPLFEGLRVERGDVECGRQVS